MKAWVAVLTISYDCVGDVKVYKKKPTKRQVALAFGYKSIKDVYECSDSMDIFEREVE